MRLTFRRIVAVFTMFFALAPAPLMAAADAREPLPLENWAIREVMQGVSLNPAGTKLAYMNNPTREGDPIIEIYDVDSVGEDAQRVGADNMEVTGFSWVSDTKMVVFFRQAIRKRIEGFNNGIYAGKAALYDIDTKKFTELSDNLQIEQILYNKPDTVIISTPNDRFGLNVDDDPFAGFRPRTYSELNLETGRTSLIIKGNERTAQVGFDDEGNPRFSQGYDRAAREFVFYYRDPGERDWRELKRLDSFLLEAQNFQPTTSDHLGEGKIMVLANNGQDKVGLWEFDTEANEFGDLIYSRDEADLAGFRTTVDFWNRGNEVVGVYYFGAKLETAWFDAGEKALFDSLEEAIPQAHNIQVSSMSRDGQTMVISNSGPKDPGSFYLLRNGELKYLGTTNPLVEPEDLSRVEYVKWTARDGRTIPGYVTIPNGEGPFPLVVVPHGGPFVSEIVGYDEWGQMLANNGYMVLQPQYRGSLGYGIDHWESAYDQGGLAMQDDKDDGALYLVEQGLADPDRLAMFGWSYGGYAAAVAASREPNIYQCTIAGAAVVDGNMQLNYYRDGLLPATEYWELRRRNGVQPLDEVEKVNIPLLLIHGDVDQRVPFEHYERYTRALDRAGVEYEGLVLEGADHFYNTLFFDHQKDMFTSIIDFLQNECGPGGL